MSNTAGLIENTILIDGGKFNVLTEQPSTRLINFIVSGEEVCSEDCGCGEYRENVGAEYTFLLAMPYVHYVFEYLGSEIYELVYVLFSNGLIDEALPICYAPLPNMFESSVCMPGKEDVNRIEVIANFWQTQFNYDGDLESFMAWNLLCKKAMNGDREGVLQWWEENFDADSITSVDWPNEFKDLTIAELSEEDSEDSEW